MAKTTTITFDQGGNMQVDQVGFTGKACEKATADLMEGIGAKAKAERKKPEYNMIDRSSSRSTVAARR